MVLFFNQYYKYNDELFIFLSFFVIATIRFYPAYNVMLSSLSRMRSNVLAFHNISFILKDFNENLYNKEKTITNSFIDFNKIKFNKINFSYDSKKIILENISFEVLKVQKLVLLEKVDLVKVLCLIYLVNFSFQIQVQLS